MVNGHGHGYHIRIRVWGNSGRWCELTLIPGPAERCPTPLPSLRPVHACFLRMLRYLPPLLVTAATDSTIETVRIASWHRSRSVPVGTAAYFALSLSLSVRHRFSSTFVRGIVNSSSQASCGTVRRSLGEACTAPLESGEHISPAPESPTRDNRAFQEQI
ncbi:hypothetical protein C8Q70DRAFT_288680 [Cubamyces menziesii]|nr:hypothetical protein C8Q70DRAFT_288680 [Cubamyces menziesii]